MPKEKTIPNKMYFRIGEAAEILAVKPYVLRYWETEFPDIKPMKSKSKQRLYKRKDVEILTMIKHLLYDQKFTISGAREHLKEMMRMQGKTEESAQFEPTSSKTKSAAKDASVSTNIKKVLATLKNDLEGCLTELRK